MRGSTKKRIRRGPAFVQAPPATAKERIAWRICAFASGSENGCACHKHGHGHCEAVGRCAEAVLTWARDDLERGQTDPALSILAQEAEQ